MAKTPLFRFLRRSARLAQISARTGMSAPEVVERWNESVRISRRSFLATAGLATAGLAAGCGRLERLTGAKGSEKGRPVLIVGGGIAGLTCAYRLHQKGVPVRVVEGQKRVGGRMYSSTGYFPEKQVCELGGELIDTGHEHLRGLAGELGFALDDYDTDDPKLSRDVWHFDGQRMKDEAVVEAFKPIAEKMAASWEEVKGDSFDYKNPNGAERVDGLSIAKWLDEAECDGWFRKLLDVGYTTEYGREIAEQSAWNLLYLIDYETPDPFRIFGESDERYHIRGGNDQVPKKLAELLGDRVETESKLESVARASDGSYRCSVRRGATSETVSADRVVLALPFTMLREVKLDVELPAAKRKAIDEIGYGTNAKLMVGFSERIWRTPEGPNGRGSNGSVLTDLPFQLTWEASRLEPGKAGILVCFTGGERGVAIGQGTPAEQSEAFVRELEKVFPGVAERRTGEIRFHWPTFPWMKASYSCYLPGQWTSICGAEGERVANLHFCGEHTSKDFQGYMEGGCESGTRAAQEILVDLGLAKPEPAEKAEEKAAA